MSGMQHIPDPYRVLGVQRAATATQIKAAHRGLAKRYHPDAPEGDTARFLAVQAAYLLLSDPDRRREWDARHAPGPLWAGEGTTRGRGRPAAGRWTREDTDAGARRGPRPPRRGPAGEAGPSRATGRSGSERSGPRGYDPPDDAPHDPHQPRTGPDRWSASGRDPGIHSYTWSAEGVPWWEDFPGPRHRTRAADAPRPTAPPGDPDVYSRSSGAAWSSAARRYFRQGDSDLPSRGVFRRQGTQYVTGARARASADAEARSRAAASQASPATRPTANDVRPGGTNRGDGTDRRESVLRTRPGPAAPRQAFHHEPEEPREHRPSQRTDAVTPRDGQRASVLTDRPIGVRRGGVRSSESIAPAAPTIGRRVAELSLAWLPLAAGIGYAAPAAAGCSILEGDCPAALPYLQAVVAVLILALFVVFPRAARIGAIATAAALSVAVPLLLAGALLGLLPPAQPIAIAALFIVAVVYLVGAGAATWAALRYGAMRRPSGP